MPDPLFLRGEYLPQRPNPIRPESCTRRILRVALSSPIQFLLTVGILGLLLWLAYWLITFTLLQSVGSGGAEACRTTEGACWPFIGARFGQFLYGLYPAAQTWRPNLVFAVVLALVVVLAIPRAPFKRLCLGALMLGCPILGGALLYGAPFGLPVVPPAQWGGLLLTVVVGGISISYSMPFGILLALARRSKIGVVSLLAAIHIEIWRGIPLIMVLFFATRVLPFFLDPSMGRPPDLVSVLFGVVLFSSAYMAEILRGGLQGIPGGQYEASMALGLTYWQTQRLVILPQVMRQAIPVMVSLFIGLFKDTTLVEIVGLYDFLGQIILAMRDPAWAMPTVAMTGFTFAGLVYFTCCYAMSRYSRFLEAHLSAQQSR